MAVRNGGAQPSAAPRNVRGCAPYWSKPQVSSMNQAGRIEIELPGKPVAALAQNVRALLLLGVRKLLKVISWRSKKRQSADEKRAPQLAIRRSWISSSVMSGRRRMRPSR